MIRLFWIAACILLFAGPSYGADQAGAVDSAGFEQPRTQKTFLPIGYLFTPLIADQKQPRFFVSYRRYTYHDNTINAGTVGYGELFGLHRSINPETGDGWQVSLGGGLFAQFDLDAHSRDLVNADYTVGVPIDVRRGATAWRISLYHQSSHLGDEYLLRAMPKRIELSYEAINVVGSVDRGDWRFYGGGEGMVHKVPHDLHPLSLQAGVEYRSPNKVGESGFPVVGFDMKSYQEHEWAINSTLNGGLEFRGDPPGNRYLRLLLEGYKGFMPHGQFYTDRVSYYGIGLYLGY